MLELVVQRFNEILLRSDLLPLYNDKNIKVSFYCGEESAEVWIHKSSLSPPAERAQTKIEISADDHTLHAILEGKLKLREAIDKGIKIEGSFQHLLLLEALFYLSAYYPNNMNMSTLL